MLSLLMSLLVRVACCKRDSTETTFGNNSRRFHVIRQNCSLWGGGGGGGGRSLLMGVQNVLPETAKI